MPLFKNMSGQKLPVYAYDSNGAKTGIAASITGSVSKDGASSAAIANTNPTEIGGGWYLFSLTQAESDANLLVWFAQSSTTGVKVEGGAAFTVTGIGNLPTVDISTIGGDSVPATPTLEGSLASGAVTGAPTTTTTQLLGSAFSSVDDAYNPSASVKFWLWPTTGVHAGIPRLISDYAGATRTVTHAAYPIPLSPSDEIKIVTQLLAA